MDEYVAYYDCFDEDQVLFVQPEKNCTKNHVIVHQGTQKACRTYILREQDKKKATTVPEGLNIQKVVFRFRQEARKG